MEVTQQAGAVKNVPPLFEASRQPWRPAVAACVGFHSKPVIMIDRMPIIRFRPEADTLPEAEIDLLMSVLNEIIAEMAMLESEGDLIKPAIALECPD